MPGPEAALGRGEKKVRYNRFAEPNSLIDQTLASWKPESQRIATTIVDTLRALNARTLLTGDTEGNVVVRFAVGGFGLPRKGVLHVGVTPDEYSIGGGRFPFEDLQAKPEEVIVKVFRTRLRAEREVDQDLNPDDYGDLDARVQRLRGSSGIVYPSREE